MKMSERVNSINTKLEPPEKLVVKGTKNFHMMYNNIKFEIEIKALVDPTCRAPYTQYQIERMLRKLVFHIIKVRDILCLKF